MSTRKRGPPPPSQPPPPAKIPSTSQARNRSPKPVYFRINKIQVGEWTQDSSPIEALRARIYGGSNRLVWELDHRHAGKRKIEIVLGNVSSMQFSFGNNATGVMEVELENPPEFFLETDHADGNRKIESIGDFTTNTSASLYRHHKLFFGNDVLRKIQETITSFTKQEWDDVLNRQFPNKPDLQFSQDAQLNQEEDDGDADAVATKDLNIDLNVVQDGEDDGDADAVATKGLNIDLNVVQDGEDDGDADTVATKGLNIDLNVVQDGEHNQGEDDADAVATIDLNIDLNVGQDGV
ncbi:hypothetical protein ISN45_Aa01g007930 [Arabidopsis thaliana x Arabidopsis arenosa]|uniref:TRF2/HOY1 PH-like domain-containing protein n=1 Tax=Arabidopsis thaliana x Arabidopsis arenosa TaxID=1240361 RepID=A0A8T2BWM1_9BRAS|nr:hypothetical protein ISN45_Aa01g007930 [Arabidopsis thaliana x Arabidopsis arenosa]